MPSQGKRQRFLSAHQGHLGDTCVEWPFSAKADGYGLLRVAGKATLAHREMCRRVHGEPPFSGAQAAHSCDNRLCINPNHLRWLNNKANEEDKLRHRKAPGRNALGHKKFSPGEATAIAADHRPTRELAAEYGCSINAVNDIRAGRLWSSVTGVKRAA